MEHWMYYSTKTKQYLNPENMHVLHLQHAVDLIGRDDHPRHQPRSHLHVVMLELLTKAYRVRMGELTTGQPTSPVKSEAWKRRMLEQLRERALHIARRQGWVSADVLRSELKKDKITPPGLMFTAVFRDKRFKYIGFERSTWEGARGRYINIWRAA